MENGVAEVLERHRAFWRREKVDRPLTSVRKYSGLAPRRLRLADGTVAGQNQHLTPEMLDAQVLGGLESDSSSPSRSDVSESILDGDAFSVRPPYIRMPWVEAILGCPVVADGSSGAIWSEPFVRNVNPPVSLALRPDSGWYRLLLDLVRLLVKRNNGSYLVSDAQSRGPVDQLGALLGQQEMCLAIYDAPEAVRKLLDAISDVIIELVKGQQEIIPLFHGGYCSQFGIWAPGRSVWSSCDLSAILSPRIFAEVIVPFEEKIFRHFDYSVMHHHSTYLHMTLDAHLASECPRAINVFLDSSANFINAKELVPTCKKILERKPLMLGGRMHIDDFEYFVENLPPAGLYVRANLDPEEFAHWEASAGRG